MTMQQKSPPPTATASKESFRQQIAGLVTPATSGDTGTTAAYRETAVRLAVILARHYNRDVLDPLSLWDRIETALRSGAGKSGDAAMLMSAMLEHVKAGANVASRDDQFVQLVGQLEAADSAWLDGLRRYILTRIYVVIALGRQAWEADKRARSSRKTADDEAAALERGERPSGLFAASEVDAALRRRAKQRGEEVKCD